MKILKFGGSSVATPKRINGVIKILKDYYSRGEKFAVVFSAFGGVTDSLIEMSDIAAGGDEKYIELFENFHKRHLKAAKELLPDEYQKEIVEKLDKNHNDLRNLLKGIFLVGECTLRTKDHLLSFGERNSCFIIANALRHAGVNASYLDARNILKTDENFGSANINNETSEKNIREYFNTHPEVQIVTGFIASSNGRCTTTLGRGGSDFTAAILGAALNAEHIEIWTDVNGVLTANPNIVKNAFTIKEMTFAEAMEMSHFGAKVIYPPTIQPVLDKNIPILIKNTFNPEFEGTFISNKSTGNKYPIKGITSIGEVSLLTLQGSGMFGVPGIASKLFTVLAANEINLILITQGSSEHSITFAIPPEFAKLAKKVIEKAFEFELEKHVVEPINIENGLSVIAVIGENMAHQIGISGKTFQALGKKNVNIHAIAQGSSELNISIVVKKEKESIALNALHNAFFESDKKRVNLFVIGTGLIGSTLLAQISQQKTYLLDKHDIDMKVAGLADIENMVFSESGIHLDDWKNELLEKGGKMNMPDFLNKMAALNLPHSIFVDNTASEFIAGFYDKILDAGISISTPNKKAMSGAFLQYKRLKEIAKNKNVRFQYEANVGAGLPVLSTLNDLKNSGDEFLKIEGVLSGSLSYIFNNFEKGVKFSDVVKNAKELGYTEPDPREDLLGNDVKRKLTILAREIGLGIEGEDIEVKNILPKSCIEAKTVSAFFDALEKEDAYFEKMITKASDSGMKLRFIGVIENGKAKIELKEINGENPFYSLSGSDNMIVFTTKRYKDNPLVIRGPGAGAEVTAGGVFAEIIKIGKEI